MMSPSLPFDRTHLPPGTRVCVAVSGGADSVALLTALYHANGLERQPLGVGLTAVHVHHGLRGEEADADAAFVKDLCGCLGIPLDLHCVDTPGWIAETGSGVEEAARTLRHAIFDRLLASGRAEAVVTAHTLDDQAETVLMKLLRGAWTEGLSGIFPVVMASCGGHGRIVRPLLAISRAEVLAWLRQQNQPWREDASNLNLDHTRNRLRHRILPLLREENPALDRTLANLAELAREEESRWQAELSRLLPQLLLPGKPVRGGGRAVPTSPEVFTVAVEVDRLRALDPATRSRVLRAAARSLGTPASRGPSLSFSETARLLALCGLRHDPTVAACPGTVLELGGGLRAERSARELRLTRTVPQK